MPVTRHTTFRLDQVAEIVAGNPAPQDSADFADEGATFIRMQDVGRAHHSVNLTDSVDHVSFEAVERHRLRLFPSGSVLIPKSGASVNLNHRAMLGRDAYVVSHLAVLLPDRTRLLPEYLFYWSLVYDPRSQAQTTSLPSLPLSLIKAAEISVPSLEDQRRIVDLLSRADGIVRLRREAEKKAGELIPTLFLDLFGDPATNPKGYQWATVDAILQASIRNGVSPSKSGLINGRVLTLSAITRGSFNADAMKEATFAGQLSPDHEVNRNDFLVCRGNGNLDLVGRGCFPTADMPGVAFPDTAIAVRPSMELVDREFFGALWHTRAIRQQIEGAAKTTNGTYKINQVSLAAIRFPLPTLAAQRAFAENSASVESIRSQQIAATAKAQAAFDALLARCFAPAVTQ